MTREKMIVAGMIAFGLVILAGSYLTVYIGQAGIETVIEVLLSL